MAFRDRPTGTGLVQACKRDMKQLSEACRDLEEALRDLKEGCRDLEQA